MIFVWILAAIVVAWTIAVGGKDIYSRRKYHLSMRQSRRLSWPARQILKEYYALPVESQPYGSMLAAVRALDVKHGRKDTNNHFRHSGYEDSCRSWRCRCAVFRNPCEFYDYHELIGGIRDIDEAIAERAHLLEMAKVESGLEEVEEITKRMREERDLIKSVTKELT